MLFVRVCVCVCVCVCLYVVPEEFMYNPVSRSYGEPHKRPEVQNATIEFIAPSVYMVGFNSSNDVGFIKEQKSDESLG